jgi:hypothetical protein
MIRCVLKGSPSLSFEILNVNNILENNIIIYTSGELPKV